MEAEKAELLTVGGKFAKLPYEQVLVEIKRRFFALAAFFEEINTHKDRAVSAWLESFWPKSILPIYLTAARIAIGLILPFELLLSDNDHTVFVIFLFSLGIATDFLAEPLTRTLRQETSMGEVLDSVADRMLMVPVAVYALFGMHYWLALWIVIFEAINVLVSIRHDPLHPIVKSNIFARINLFLQAVALLGILVYWPNTPHVAFIILLWFSVIALVISIFIKIKDAA